MFENPNALERTMQDLKAYTWGYYGWGSASKEFVRAVDSHEKERGYEPPMFVDIRFHRSVKAANFRDNTFRNIVGSDRYVWEKRLGNKRIGSKTGSRMEIADPSAASDLLDRLIDLKKQKKRALLFCACLQPLDEGHLNCHRVRVADLLLEEAKKRRIKLTVAEWPGDAPTKLNVKVNPGQERALQRGSVYIPIGPTEGNIPQAAVLG